MYEYQFPKYIKTKPTIGMQICKVLDEAKELQLATDIEQICVECFDVIHACETLLRIIEQGESIEPFFYKTIAKNEERKYYNER